jgi:hypothetical protein
METLLVRDPGSVRLGLRSHGATNPLVCVPRDEIIHFDYANGDRCCNHHVWFPLDYQNSKVRKTLTRASCVPEFAI